MGRDWKRWRESREKRSLAAARAARIRWDRYHAGLDHEPQRIARRLMALTVQRPGIDRRPVAIAIYDDGAHRRRMIIEDGQAWTRRCGRKALVGWFGRLLKSAGV